MNEDSSERRKVSHHRLKSEIVNLTRFEKLFPKSQIIQIGKPYDPTLSQNIKKSLLIQSLADKLENAESMPYPDKLARSQFSETPVDVTPSTSTDGATDQLSTSTATDQPSTGRTGDEPLISTYAAISKQRKPVVKRKGMVKNKIQK